MLIQTQATGLLAAIVEMVSGKSIDAFSRERLFRPIGMNSSGYFFSEEMARRLAVGYMDGEDAKRAETVEALGGDYWNVFGNGGIQVTLGDMHKLMKALEQGKLLKKDSLQKYFRPHDSCYSQLQKLRQPALLRIWLVRMEAAFRENLDLAFRR
jgi:CubicO group peptidase (beta-lactamase class C family)